MSQTRDQKRFTTSEVAADWHELMILQRTMIDMCWLFVRIASLTTTSPDVVWFSLMQQLYRRWASPTSIISECVDYDNCITSWVVLHHLGTDTLGGSLRGGSFVLKVDIDRNW